MNSTSSKRGKGLFHDALARHQAGDLASARSLYVRHLEARPADVGAWCALASVEGQSGHHDRAAEASRRALAIDPDCVPAHANLGTSGLHGGDFEDALRHLRRTVELDPGQIGARLQLAIVLRRLGRLPEATEALEGVLERQPDHPQANLNLGFASLEGGSPDRAEACFRRALESRPELAAAHAGLGRALIARNRPLQARVSLEKAMALAPGDRSTVIAFGTLLTACGSLEEARAAFEQVAAPDQPQALAGLAEIDRLEGHPDAALERLASLPADAPGGIAVMRARLLLEIGRRSEAESFARERLGTRPLLPRVRVALLRELGTALDRRGDIDGAWAAWTEANEATRGDFDADEFNRAIDALVGAFDESLFSAPPAWDGPRPLLLIGAPRAGKSLLEQMLACHPAIHGAGELRALGKLARAVPRHSADNEPYPACVRRLDAEGLRLLSMDYQAELAAAAPGATWITDTLPTNFLHVGLARLLCDGVRLIYCRRNAPDLAWACYSRGFADPALAFASAPDRIADYLAGLGRALAHWQRVLPGGLMTVDYEQLVRSPEPALRRLLGELGLDWDPACGEYFRPGRAKLSVPPALSGPVSDAEVGRGGAYRDRFPTLAGDPPDGPDG